jgi:flagellar protein FliO/FliZ
VITKKLLELFFILLLFIPVMLSAQNSDEEPEPTTVNDGVIETDTTENYVIVPEESLIILDAQDPAVVENTTVLNTFSVWDFVRMLLVLGAVLGFIYFIFFLFKKIGKPKLISDSTIGIISTKNLEPGRSLHLIEIGSQVFLIGSGESSVQLITEITEKETLDTINMDKSIRNEGSSTFTDIFRGLFKKDIDTQTKPVPINFIKKQRERLRGM